MTPIHPGAEAGSLPRTAHRLSDPEPATRHVRAAGRKRARRHRHRRHHLDLAAALELGLFDGPAAEAAPRHPARRLTRCCAWPRGTACLAAPGRRDPRRRQPGPCPLRGAELAPHTSRRDNRLELPATIGDYTDFLPAFITRRMPASCFAPTTRCCRTTNRYRSATTAARRRSGGPAPRCDARTASANPRRSRSRTSALPASTTSSSSAC